MKMGEVAKLSQSALWAGMKAAQTACEGTEPANDCEALLLVRDVFLPAALAHDGLIIIKPVG